MSHCYDCGSYIGTEDGTWIEFEVGTATTSGSTTTHYSSSRGGHASSHGSDSGHTSYFERRLVCRGCAEERRMEAERERQKEEKEAREQAEFVGALIVFCLPFLGLYLAGYAVYWVIWKAMGWNP